MADAKAMRAWCMKVEIIFNYIMILKMDVIIILLAKQANNVYA